MAPKNGGDSLASEFRRQFLEELGRRNLTMADVARAYGCSNENIAQLVGGDRDLRLGTADRLCQAIGVHLTIQIEE
jgi:plasmid maintenance system antidote protein VapI